MTFKIFTNNNSVMQRQMTKEIASISARKEIEDNIRYEQNNLKQRVIQDRQQSQKNLIQWEKCLSQNAPERLSSEAENAMWKRAKQLKDEFTVGMLSKDELHPVKQFVNDGVVSVSVDDSKLNNVHSVTKELAWLKNNEQKVREYKNIMRHLCPDDPSAADIEKWRTYRSVR